MKNITHLQKRERFPLDVAKVLNVYQNALTPKISNQLNRNTYSEEIFTFENLVQWDGPVLMVKNRVLQAKCQPESIRLQTDSNRGCDADFPYAGKPHMKRKHLPTPTENIICSASVFHYCFICLPSHLPGLP